MPSYSNLPEFFSDKSTIEIKRRIENISEPDIYSDNIAFIKLSLEIENSPNIFSKVKLPKTLYDRVMFFLKNIREPAVIFQSQPDEASIENYFKDIEKDFDFFIEKLAALDKNLAQAFVNLKDLYREKLTQWQKADAREKQILAQTPARIYSESFGVRIISQKLACEMAYLDPKTGEAKTKLEKSNEDGIGTVIFIGEAGRKIVCKINDDLNPLETGQQKIAQIYYEEFGSNFVVPTTYAKVEVHINGKRATQLIQITEAIENGIPFNHIIELSDLFKFLVKNFDKKILQEKLSKILFEDYFKDFLIKHSISEDQIEAIPEDKIFLLLKDFIRSHPTCGIKCFNANMTDLKLEEEYRYSRTNVKTNLDFLKLIALLEIVPELGSTQYDLAEAVAIPKRLSLSNRLFPSKNLDKIINVTPDLGEMYCDHLSLSKAVVVNQSIIQEDLKADNVLMTPLPDQDGDVQSFIPVSHDSDRILEEPIKTVKSFGETRQFLEQKDALLLLNRNKEIHPAVLKEYLELSLEGVHLNILTRLKEFNQRIYALYFLHYLDVRIDAFEPALLDNEITGINDEDKRQKIIEKFKYNGVFFDLAIFDELRAKFPEATLDCPIHFLAIEDAFKRDEEIQAFLKQKQNATLHEIHQAVNEISAFFYNKLANFSTNYANRRLYGKNIEITEDASRQRKNIEITELVRLDNNTEAGLVLNALEKIPPQNNQEQNTPAINDVITSFIKNKLQSFLRMLSDDEIYDLLKTWAIVFPFIQELPIPVEQLTQYFYLAIDREDTAVMQLLLNCHFSLECTHPVLKKSALDIAVVNKRTISFLFLIAAGAGKEFDFEKVFDFFQENLKFEENKALFEKALYQLCQTNFKFFLYYFRHKLFVPSNTDEFDAIDPLTNTLLQIREEQKSFFSDMRTTTRAVLDGLPIEIDANSNQLFFYKILNHHCANFFDNNLIQPEETLVFKQENKMGVVNFRLNFNLLSLEQLPDNDDQINLLNLTEILLLAILFRCDFYDSDHIAVIRRPNGRYDFVIRCQPVSEKFENDSFSDNILFSFDLNKIIPQEFFSSKKAKDLTELSSWFAFFSQIETQFGAFLKFCDDRKLEVEDLLSKVSKKLLLNSANEKLILESLYKFQLFFDLRAKMEAEMKAEIEAENKAEVKIKMEAEMKAKMEVSILALIEHIDLEIAHKARSKSKKLRTEPAKKITHGQPSQPDASSKTGKNKRSSIFFSQESSQIFKNFIRDRKQIQNIIDEFEQGNFDAFEKLISPSMQQAVLTGINFYKMNEKIFAAFIKKIEEEFHKKNSQKKSNEKSSEENMQENRYEALTYIEQLSFFKCSKISFKQIKVILEKTRRLRSLNLSGLDLKEDNIKELIVIALINNSGLKKLLLNDLKNLTELTITTIKANKDIRFTVKPKLQEISLDNCLKLTKLTLICPQLETLSFLRSPVAELVLFEEKITSISFSPDIAKFNTPARAATILLQSPQLLKNFNANKEFSLATTSSETILNVAQRYELLPMEKMPFMMPPAQKKWSMRSLILSPEQTAFLIQWNIDQYKKNNESVRNTLQSKNVVIKQRTKEIWLDVNFFASELSIVERLILSFQNHINQKIFSLYDFLSAAAEDKQFSEVKEIKWFHQTVMEDFWFLVGKDIVQLPSDEHYQKTNVLFSHKQNILSFGVLTNGNLVTAESLLNSDKSESTMIRVWDCVSKPKMCIQEFIAPQKTTDILITPNNQVICIHRTGVSIWNPYEAKEIASQTFDSDYIQSFCLVSAFSLLALGLKSGTVILMSLINSHRVMQYDAMRNQSRSVTAIEALPNAYLALGNEEGEIALLNTEKKFLHKPFLIPNKAKRITSLKFIEGNFLISGNTAGLIALWSCYQGEGTLLKSFDFKEIGSVVAFSFFSASSILCVGAKGLRSIKINNTQLQLDIIIKYIESITIIIKAEEIRVICSLTIEQDDFEKLKNTLHKLLTSVFPELKHIPNGKSLIYGATQQQIQFVEETLKLCGFEKRIQKTEIKPEYSRARLNTLFGNTENNSQKTSTKWQPFDTKRLSFLALNHRNSGTINNMTPPLPMEPQNDNNYQNSKGG